MTIHSPFKPFKLAPCQFVLVDPTPNPALDFITSLFNDAIVPANKDPVREYDMWAFAGGARRCHMWHSTINPH